MICFASLLAHSLVTMGRISIGFNYNSDENQRSFRKNRNRTLSLPFGVFRQVFICLNPLTLRWCLPQHTFKNKQNGVNLQPGDTFSYGFGAGLSINSAVSFSGRVSGSYQFETKRNGSKIIGSSAEPISFIAGMSYRLGRKTRLETNLTLGLSDDAGDVGIGVSYLWNL